MRAIGIDLGTTNSVAAIGGKDSKVLPNQDGEPLTPSVVSLYRSRRTPDGEVVVGRQAVNNAARDPVNTIFSIKRLMGLTYGETRVGQGYGAKGVEDVRDRTISYPIAAAPAAEEQDQGIKVILGDKTYSPVDISSMILSKVRDDARMSLGEAVTHAVITVPAYFEERQRSATIEAGRQAGLSVLKVIDEPTAAAVAFGIGKADEQHRILVFDLGGGTFDISIIQMYRGQTQVLEIQGDNWLGGDDFDATILKRILGWFQETYGSDPSNDRGFLAVAKQEAQRAKIALSSQQSFVIDRAAIKVDGRKELVDLDLEVTRDDFENDIRPLVERTIDLARLAMKNQGFSPEQITEVLLVGGSTSVPLVQQEVMALFGNDKVKRHVNPMECVALGAAHLADQFTLQEDGQVESRRVDESHVEITATHLGIAAVKGNRTDIFVPIIPKGTPYPLSAPRTQVFYPTTANQRVIRVPVYEGLNELASLNEQQGVVEVPLEEEIDTSTPVEVYFNYDRNRTLTVGVRIIGSRQPPFEEALRRDRPRSRAATAETESLADDWREDLQPAVRAGRHFLENFGEYMDEPDRKELSDAIEEGDRALKAADEKAGTRCTLVLQNKMMTSGTASQLFIAERAMHGAPEAEARDLAQAIANLRTAHKRGRTAEVEKLSDILRLRVANILEMRRSIQSVEDRQDLQNLLRVRE